ncbi:unnamed protein product [Rhizophagus irregularis]|nr:unnamed protein product [Rhizophagus irregularis]
MVSFEASFGIRLRKVGKWVFRYSSSESREMGFRCFDFGKRRTERNAGRLDNEFETNGSRRLDDSGRLDDEFRNEPVPDVRMMETTGSGRLDNGNQNEPKR